MRYVVLAFLCLIAIIGYVQRLGVQTAFEPIQRELAIDTAQFGAIGTAWLIGYAIMQLPAGWLADRLGSRNALTLYALAWSSVTACVGLCRDFETMLAAWFVMGMAQAGIFPCAAKAIAAWFVDTEKATASGLVGSSTMLGTALASLLTTWLVIEQGLSWQITYIYFGSAGALWAVVYFCAIPERRGSHVAAPPMTHADWTRMFSSMSMWLICGQQFFRAGAMIFFINWFPKFLRESRSLSDSQAGVYTSYANFAALLGGVLGGFFSDWLLRRTGWRRLSRQGIAIAGMTTAALMVLATYRIADNVAAIAVFSIGAFVATFGGVSGYTVTIEFGGRRVATVFSLMNTCGNFGAALFGYLAGVLKQMTDTWTPALFVFAGIFALDAICWSLLNPPGPLFGDDDEPR